MSKEYLNKVISDITSYCTSNNISLPKTADQYDKITRSIHCHHRATLTAHGLSFSKDIKPIFYARPYTAAYTRCVDFCNIHNLKLSGVDPYTATRTAIANIECKVCGYSENVSMASIIRRKNGCKSCEHNIPIVRKVDLLRSILEDKGFSTDNDLDSITSSSSITTKCNNCGSEDIRTVAHLLYRSEAIMYCKVCNPPPIYGKQGKRSVYNNIPFDSDIELCTYKLLESRIGMEKIECHIPYSKLGISSSYICDFLVDNTYVLEVSSFNRAHHESYHQKIENKFYLIESSTPLTFIFCNSLTDVKDFIDTFSFIHT